MSADEDSKTAKLNYTWTCSIASQSNFGTSCPFSGQFLQGVYVGLLTVPPLVMTSGITYNFGVTAASADGRSSSTGVAVTAAASGVPYLSAADNRVKFNIDLKLDIIAYVQSDSDVSLSWETLFGSQNISMDSIVLTKPSRILLASEATLTRAFPLSFVPHAFTPGHTYTFRLTAYPVSNPTLVAFSQVTMVANTVPSGGYTIVAPQTGTGLSTTFLMTTVGWSADQDNYPLSFAFGYQLAVSAKIPALLIRTYSTLPHTSSNLPSGLQANSYNVSVVALVMDVYLSSSSVSYNVVVHPNASFSATAYLSNILQATLASKDVDATYQAINLVSSTISAVNCSSTPPARCYSIWREPCLTTSGSCESCLPGFVGEVGDSNRPCFNATLKQGQVGSVCNKDNDCMYHLCRSGRCDVGNQTCPTDVPGSVCSGHGLCLYRDISGKQMSKRLVTTTSCYSYCSCVSGYGSSDCHLNAHQLAQQSAARVDMCSALLSVIAAQDPSTQVLDSIVSALLSAYDETEITSIQGKATCSKVINYIGKLASKGYLRNAQADTIAFYSEITSQFISSVNSPRQTSTTKTSRSLAATPQASLESHVQMATKGLTAGVLKTMVSGQTSTSLVTDNIRTLVSAESRMPETKVNVKETQPTESFHREVLLRPSWWLGRGRC